MQRSAPSPDGRDHVVTVGGRAVADHLGIDSRAARLGVFELFQHHHAGAAGDDEAVAADVVGTRGGGGCRVVFRGHRAHGVEQHRQRPVQFLAAAGEDHVLLADLDGLIGVADAMVRGRAGRRDRIVHALDLEPGRERGRRGGGHRLRHRERTDPLGALGAGDVGCLHDGARGRSAGAHDDTGADVGDLLRRKPGVLDRLLHGNMIPRSPLAEEAHRAPVDDIGRIEGRGALHLRTEAELGVFFRTGDTGFRLMKARKHLLGVVSDGRDDTHPRDDNPPHDRLALPLCSSVKMYRCVIALLKSARSPA